MSATLVVQPTLALANPQGGVVSAGQAAISESGSTLSINQASDRAVIDWRGFDIAHGETTQFQQPSSSSIALNRVNSGSASQINGNLTANGNVVIVNQNGVMFGGSAKVDVNGLVATTADIGNDAFMNNSTLAFDKPGDPNAAIVNNGQITAGQAGLVGFVAPNVVNNGVISAKLGRVHLASGDTATVDMYGDGLMNVAVSDQVKSQLVSNTGLIEADGGTVALTAAAGKNVVNSLITVAGELRAPAVAQKSGEIIIYAEGSNAVNGNVAASKGQKTGSSTVLVSGTLDASGRNPGERGGKITVTGDNVALLDGTFIDASGSDGLPGITSGQAKSAYRPGSAGGDIRIGGDYLGGGDTPTALNLYVDPGVLVLNDSLSSGDAGRTIFWSDNNTSFYGNVYARALGGKAIVANTWNATAGGNSGDGGFVETSGHGHLDAGGYVDLTASNGSRGTYFLDPTDITIYGNVDPTFASTDGSINLGTNLKLWLDASDTGNVNLTYNSLGTTATGTSGQNTITVSANTSLVVGARIRLGGAGSVTAASTLGADTYTITNISGTTITLSSNLTSSYAGSGVYQGYVSQLTDKSGQGNNATQGTAGNMPLWISNGINNLSTVDFTGVANANLHTGAFALNQPISEFITFQSNDTTGNHYVYDGLGGNTDVLQVLSGKLTLYNGSIDPTLYTTGRAITTSTAYAHASLLNGASTTTYLNGGSALTGNPGASSPSGITLGNYGGGSFGFNGLIGDMYAYNTTLSTNARNLVDQYQSAKWGIALTPPGTGATEVAKATASDGYSVFTTRYLERLSQSADISLQATNNINLDFKGDTLNFATSGRALTLTAGNQITTASTGAITTNNGAISLTGTNGILLNNAFAFNSGTAATTLNTTNSAITFSNALTLGGNTTLNAGSGTVTFGSTVNGGYNLTATAGTFSFARPLGQTTPLGAVSLTSANALILPTIFASSIAASTTSGNLSGVGGLITNGGNISLSAANDLDLSAMGLVSNGGNATLSSGRDTILNTQISTGTGDLTVNATRDLFVTKSDLTTGLVSYYKFDEGSGGTTADSSGNGNTGTLTNGPTWTSANPYGLAGNNSLSFDGVNDYVLSTSNYSAAANSPVTISAWVNPATLTNAGAYYRRVITLGNQDFSLVINAGTALAYYNGGVSQVADAGALATGTWYHLTAVFDGSSVHLYRDGVQVNSAASGLNAVSAVPVPIGIFTDHANGDFNGTIDDVRIYNTALSATKITQLYAPQVSWSTGTTNLTAGRNVSLDLKGDTLTTGAGKNLTITAGNNISAASAGTLATSQNAGAGGNVTMTASGTGTIDTSSLALNVGGAASLTSAGAMTLGNITAKTITAQSTGITSDLTIAAAKTLTASGTGNALTLASGRNFINSAGSSALSAASGRWLVYSTNPANDTIGGLSNGFRRFTCAYGGSCPSFPGTGNGLLYSYTPTLTITPSGLNIIYGDAVPNLTGYGYSLAGYLGSDSSSDSLTGSLTGTTPYTQGNNVGTYAINYSSGSLASALGYGFSYANNSTGLTVGKKTLTASLTGTASKTYDATTAATLAAGNYSLSGIYGADDVGISTTSGTYDTKNVGTGKTVSVSGLALSGTTAGNYQLASNSASGAIGTIFAKALTVTADNKNMIYGGTEPTLTYSYTGLAAGDSSASFSGVLAHLGTNAGTYSIVQNTLAANGNYTIGSYIPGVFIINAATPIFTPSDIPATVTRVSQNPTLVAPMTGGLSNPVTASFSNSSPSIQWVTQPEGTKPAPSAPDNGSSPKSRTSDSVAALAPSASGTISSASLFDDGTGLAVAPNDQTIRLMIDQRLRRRLSIPFISSAPAPSAAMHASH